MPFNSLRYLLFLPVVYLVFYVAGERARWLILLTASLLFYAALNVPYLLVVLILVSVSTYSFGIWLAQAKSKKAKRALLWSGVVTNVMTLIVMKYLPFLSENLIALTTLFSLETHIQPVTAFVALGVSYYVFQAISYLFDIYFDMEKPEQHFGYFALYLAFFPKLLQGPIERSRDLIPQLKSTYEFNYDNIRFGMFLFTWGLFKKLVIADRLGLYVDLVYKDVYAFTGLPLLLATYAYAFQIYMDFSGYTDMALGSARLFNINLTQNFNSPYLATSVADFWRRWHISFSRWILDYIFKPLQMQWRNGKSWGTAAALVAAFLVSGIWHGASWGFVIWGGLHGIFMASSVFFKPYQKKLYKSLELENSSILNTWKIFVTFNLVSFAWVFFRAATIKDAMYVASNMYFSSYKGLLIDLLLSPLKFDMAILVSALILYLSLISAIKSELLNFKIYTRWAIYIVLINFIMYFKTNETARFIYAQF